MKTADLIARQAVAEAIENGDGFWRSCSGCHELNDGAPTGRHNETFRCHLGLGCSECGGIGAVWDTTDYADMGDYLAAEMAAEDARITVLRARLATLEAEAAALRAALRENYCPRPCNNRPSGFEVGQCVDAGECGCMNATLAKEGQGHD